MATSKRRSSSFLVIALAVVAPFCAYAEPTIGVEDAVMLALRSNLGVENARLQLENKTLIKDTVWNRFIPSLTAGATLSRLNVAQQVGPSLIPTAEGPPGVFDQVIVAPGFDLPHWGMGLRVQAQLTLSTQMLYGVRQTVLDYQSGLTTLDKARADLERDVRKQFYNLLLLQESIKLQEGAIRTASQRLDQTKTNYQNGLIDEYSYLSAQVALANLQPVLDGLQSAHETAVMAFDQTIGIDVKSKPVLSGAIQADAIDIGPEDADLLIRRFLDRRYDLKSLKEAAGQIENLIEATRSAFYPTLTLGYSVDPTFMGDPFKDPWFSDIANSWKQVSGAFSVTVGVSLDQLLPASQTRVQLAGYESQLRQARNSLAQARNGAEIEVRKTISTLLQTQSSLEVRRLNVRLARRALDLAETGYRSGTRDFLDVRSAEQDLQKAQLDELSDKYDYVAALLDLQAALNTPIAEIRKTIHGNEK